MGCFEDKNTRAITGGYETFQAEAIKNCYLKAKEEGNMFFAVEYGEQCFTSPYAGETYNIYGANTGCNNGKGDGFRMNVYRLAGILKF